MSISNSVNIDKILSVLKDEFYKHKMPVVDLIQIQTNDPYKVLVTTILSARTKDETTSIAAQKLFKSASNLNQLSKINENKLRDIIYPVGFYKTKAIHLSKLKPVIDQEFGGIIPDTVEDLIKLPGVGRKTANLVVAIAFDKPAICVDIHVHRICNRLGYLNTETPLETEMTLRRILPLKYWKLINSYIVSFGQNLCSPINPHCDICPIYKYCRRINVKTKFKI